MRIKYLIAFLAVISSFIYLNPGKLVAKGKCNKGLIAYWSFDDSTATDNSGNGYNGTIVNTPKPIPGYNKKGTAFQFTGRGYYSLLPEVPPGDHILLPQIPFDEYDEFTISMWVNEQDLSAAAGEAYIYFGEHMNGWFGIMNHKVPSSSSFDLFTQYSIGGTADTSTVVMAKFDGDLRDKWRQYVLVYNKGLIQCYRNGIFVGEKISKINVSASFGAIGRHWWKYDDGVRTSARFTGGIDEVKIYCRALTKEEIEEEYNPCESSDLDELEIIESPKPKNKTDLEIKGVKVNLEGKTSIHLKNISSKPVSIYEPLLKNKNFYFKPGIFPLNIVPNATYELEIFIKKDKPGHFEDEFVIQDFCTNYTFYLRGEVVEPICKDGLIAYWSFDDGTARDVSGNGFDGVLKNNPTLETGYKNGGIRLHGSGNYSTGEPSGSYIDLPNIPFNEYKEFTVSLAAKEEPFSYYSGEAMIWFGNLNNAWLGIMTNNYSGDDSGGDLYTHYSISSKVGGSAPYKAFYDTTDYRYRWVYYTMTYSNGNVKCYRNGELLNSFFQEAKPLEAHAAIGRHWWNVGSELRSSTRYNGVIDEVKIYCKALTQQEIKKELISCENSDLDELEITECPKPKKSIELNLGATKSNIEISSIIHIRNKMDYPVTIKNISFKNNNFYIKGVSFPLTFNPKSTTELPVFFKKKDKGIYNDEFTIADICTHYSINTIAEVVGAPCSNNLIAYWSFDDSTAKDNSGNGFDGKIMNNPRPKLGFNLKGTSFEFVGDGYYSDEPAIPKGDHIILPRIPFEDYDEFSLSLWVNEHAMSMEAGESYIDFGDHYRGWLGIMNHKIPDSESYDLYNQFAIAGETDTSTFCLIKNEDNYRDQWHQFVITYKNGIMLSYKDGKFVGAKKGKINIATSNGAIARHWWGGMTSTRFTGLIDEVKIYCYALTKGEIEDQFSPCNRGLGNSFELTDLPSKDSVLTLKFDSVGVGDQIKKTIKIRNKSDANVTLNSIYVTENIHFSISQSAFPLHFAPKEEKEIEVFLIPKLYGKLRDTLIINDACNPWKIALEADSYGVVDTLNGQCGTQFEYKIDSIATVYYMSLRTPRYSSSSKLVSVVFETNYDGVPASREVSLFNSLGDLVSNCKAKVTYTNAKTVGTKIIRDGYLTFEVSDIAPGVYFIKAENGMVGVVVGD